mgnify:CR=1 FL=1
MDGKILPERTAKAIKELDCFAVCVQEVPTPKTSRFERALISVGLQLTCVPSPTGEEGFGIGVISREAPLTKSTVDLGNGKSMIICTFETITVASAHLDYKSGTKRVSQSRAICSAFNGIHCASVLGIDSNDLPTSDTVRIFDGGISGMFVIPKDSTESSLTTKSDSPTREVDYLICNKDLPGIIVSRVLPDMVTSDHRPIICDVPF